MKGKISALILKNEQGAVILYVLILSLIVVGIFTLTMVTNQNAEHQLYRTRFRNQLDAFQLRWQTLLGQPSTYTNCQFDKPGSCVIDPSIIKRYQKQKLIGAGCRNSTASQSLTSDSKNSPNSCGLDCGFCAQVTLSGTVAKLVINPVGTYLRPLQAEIQIPYDVLQLHTISCPEIDETKPRFAGFDAQGNAICLPLVSPQCPYPDIQYAIGINPGTGAINCMNIPNRKVDCPDNSFMSVFGWSIIAIGNSCAPRLEPYVFNYP